jgi:formate C-acetyltransferase
MKFQPSFFKKESDIRKFTAMLRTFVELRIHHVQFNVIGPETLRAAKQNPEAYRGLTVRMAGYTAYFTELADDLQDEIIARTTYNGVS